MNRPVIVWIFWSKPNCWTVFSGSGELLKPHLTVFDWNNSWKKSSNLREIWRFPIDGDSCLFPLKAPIYYVLKQFYKVLQECGLANSNFFWPTSSNGDNGRWLCISHQSTSQLEILPLKENKSWNKYKHFFPPKKNWGGDWLVVLLAQTIRIISAFRNPLSLGFLHTKTNMTQLVFVKVKGRVLGMRFL